jgi:hypothetical protein
MQYRAGKLCNRLCRHNLSLLFLPVSSSSCTLYSWISSACGWLNEVGGPRGGRARGAAGNQWRTQGRGPRDLRRARDAAATQWKPQAPNAARTLGDLMVRQILSRGRKLAMLRNFGRPHVRRRLGGGETRGIWVSVLKLYESENSVHTMIPRTILVRWLIL